MLHLHCILTPARSSRLQGSPRFMCSYSPSPIQLPTGLSEGMLSHTAFSAAVIGTASTKPIAPHSHPQNIMATVTDRALSLTRLPTSLGVRTFTEMKCTTETDAAMMMIGVALLDWTRATNSGGRVPKATPM